IITVGPVSEYNDTKIRRGIDYSYVIRAKNLAGHGPGSESIVARAYGRPSPPRDISYVLSIEGVYLTWEVPIDDGGSELLGINLYRRMSGQEDWIMIASLSNRTVWFRDVPPSISPFDYMLTSYNLAGESDPVLIFNVTPCGKPGIPGDIDISSGDGFINLSWSPPEDDGRLPIRGYRLFRSTMDESKISIDLLPSDGYYNDTSVKNGIPYSYRILAFNELGDGVISPFFEAVPIGLPSAPVSINVTSGDRFVDISWKPPLNDGGLPLNYIRIYRSVNSSSPVMVLETSLLEGSYRDRDLDNGVEYHYFLTALNGLGEGERSDIVVAVPSRIPSSPLSLMIVPLSDGTIVLTWTPPEDDGGSPIVGYKIYRSTGDEDMSGIAEVPADDLSYVERDLKVGITYRYGVSAFNARGESELSVGTFRIDDNPSSHMLSVLIGGSFIVLLSLSIVLLYAFLNYRKKMIDTGKNGSMIERQDE
ncbi:MAG: fibronectin type III domain-containing protein, partial [Candidatus Thermoplasmatota archaeon]|nr:fibronectin type III domain-containing protein [Candidatus Thermoplasmatota archaeon]